MPWGGNKSPCFIGFDDIFGSGAGQVPEDPTLIVINATLEVYVYEKIVDGYTQLWPMATDWVEGANTGWGANEGESTGNHRYYRDGGVYDTGDFWGNRRRDHHRSGQRH